MFERLSKLPFRPKLLIYVAVGIVAVIVAATFTLLDGSPEEREVSLSELLTNARSDTYESIELDDASSSAVGTREDGSLDVAYFNLGTARYLAEALDDAGAEFSGSEPAGPSFFRDAFLTILPILILGGLILYLFLGRMGGGSGLSSFLSNKVTEADVPDTRFADVAGIDEVVDELSELVEYLRDPSKWDAVGATPPAGVLLAGPPGTGKTLLARAVAGEAGVPFYSMSGSQFVEMFVGVGARRVRDVFKAAGEAGRSIVFIDELDAIGKARTSGNNAGATEERESTLNELLVQLDGFAARSGVLVVGATNRPDVLDSALTRPKRFDRQITVPPPDRGGREKILTVYAAGKPFDDDVDLAGLARRTTGFTGATLENLVGEAARQAARQHASSISQEHVDQALATLAMGRERRSAEVLERDRQITAVHEAGHTIAALASVEIDDPVQVSIVPRGPSGGQTWLSEPDGLFLTCPAAQDQLVVALAGRAAEREVFGDRFTQGASHDLQAATRLATQMTAEWGMSSLGPVFVPEDQRQFGPAAEQVHVAVGQLLQAALDDAGALILKHRPLLERITTELLQHESLGAGRLRALYDEVM